MLDTLSVRVILASMSTTRRYNYKLRVSLSKEEKLIREFGMCRWVWNECVDRFRRGHGAGNLDKCLTEARSKNPWLREGSSTAQQQMIRRYRKALKDSFDAPGRGRPRHKTKKKSRPSLTYCLLYTSPSPRDATLSRMPSSA